MLTNSHYLCFQWLWRKEKSPVYRTVALKSLPETGHFGSHFIGSKKSRGDLKHDQRWEVQELSVILVIPAGRTGPVYPVLLNQGSKAPVLQRDSSSVMIFKFEALSIVFFTFLITRGRMLPSSLCFLFLYSVLTRCSLSPLFPIHTCLLFKVLFMRRPCHWAKALHLPCRWHEHSSLTPTGADWVNMSSSYGKYDYIQVIIFLFKSMWKGTLFNRVR